ncbi:hypothetical protein AYX15_04982 [Cryptococcus neoformans]|nr:hypothetical protein AYX15_04982 [Cryptococcus neoformans var. grubii]
MEEVKLVKISQRPAKSCTECMRRKARCSKVIPCEPCSKRGVAHLCRQEQQFGPPIPTPNAEIDALKNALVGEIDDLKRRISLLEKLEGKRREYPSSGNSEREEEGGTEAATTLEFMALGLDRRLEPQGQSKKFDAGPTTPSSSASPSSSSAKQPDVTSGSSRSHLLKESRLPLPENISNALLPQEVAISVFKFHTTNVYWQHACIYVKDFEAQVEEFYKLAKNGKCDKVDGSWIALFFVLQAISVHQMTDEYAEACNLGSVTIRQQFITAVMDAAMTALHHANFLSRPSMFTCQAIAILGLCGHNVCDSDLLSSLSAIGIKHAQTLGLHMLAKRRKGMSTVDLEMGRRVWWSLAMEDWYAIPFRGVWSIHMDQFDTPFPSNSKDEDLQCDDYHTNRPLSVVTISSKLQFSARIASIMQNTFDRLRHTPSHGTVPLASMAANELTELISQLPAPSPSQPSWAKDMRHYLRISSYHKIIIIYRACLSRHNAGSLSERRAMQRQCVLAAEAIIDELHHSSHSDPPSEEQAELSLLWTLPYHVLASCVVLSLDMIERHGENPEIERQRLTYVKKGQLALERLAGTSRIARRGLMVIEHLMKEKEVGRKRKKGSEDMADMVKRIRLPHDDPHLPHPPSHSHSHPTTGQPSRPQSHSHSHITSLSVSDHTLDNPRGPTPPYSHFHLNPLSEAIPYYFSPRSQAQSQSRSHPHPQTPSHSHHSHPYPPPVSHPHPHPHSSPTWTQEDIDALLSNLHECVPDVGRLFDGSLGSFGLPMEGDRGDAGFDVGVWGGGGGNADFGSGGGPSDSGLDSKTVFPSASASAATSGSSFGVAKLAADIWRY